MTQRSLRALKALPSIALCAAILTGGALSAQAGPFSNIFDKFDLNKNGSLNFSESKAMVDPFFNLSDKNKDGMLSPAEQQQAINTLKKDREKARQVREFKRQDTNKDKNVSRQEMHAHLLTLFKFMDSDNNGEITLNEFRVQSVKVMFDSRFN